MADHERHHFTVYPAPKNVISKADFQRLMLQRAQVVALATALDDTPGDGTAAVPPVAADQPDHSGPDQNARGAAHGDLQHLDTQAEQRRGHLVQSRCEAVTRRRRKEWEAEQARVRHAHAAAADAATAAAEARAQAAEAAHAECSRLTARVRADRQALQARRQLLATARHELTQHIEKVHGGQQGAPQEAAPPAAPVPVQPSINATGASAQQSGAKQRWMGGNINRAGAALLPPAGHQQGMVRSSAPAPATHLASMY